jgi:hypothetical protein
MSDLRCRVRAVPKAEPIGHMTSQAILHVVTTDTGIFMTTLSLDTLHPHSLEYRKSVMQLVACLFSFHPLELNIFGFLLYLSLRNLLSYIPIFRN